MSRLRLITITSVADLQRQADAWDDLWRRSEVSIPTVQAGHLIHWLQTFAPGAAVRALAVEDDGQLVAGLALAARRLRGTVPVGMLAGNEWTPAADLLLDPGADREAVLERLAEGLTTLPWSLLWFDQCIVDAARWRQLLAACERRGLGSAVHERFRVPVINIQGTWEAYRQSWSSSHRRHLSRGWRKLADEHGEPTLRLVQPEPGPDLDRLLTQGFELENRCWKGPAGTSVLRSGMYPFFLRQAELLAQRQQLELAFLEVAGRPIAFEYGWRAKGRFHPFKIAYDERFHRSSPGHLLIHATLERFFQTGSYQVYDCIGPLSNATGKWQNGHYTIGRVVIAPPRLLSQVMMYAYKHLWLTLRRWQPGATPASPATENAPAHAPAKGVE